MDQRDSVDKEAWRADKMFCVTYIKHSGFLVETDHSYLLFDYWNGTIPSLRYDKALYIFSSHAHHDHYSNDIFKLEQSCKKVCYIMSDDIRDNSTAWRKAEYVEFMGAHESRTIGSCEITTLKSNDEGVAFLVKVDGLMIYHAGDLHWWDWPGEPDEDNLFMERTYKEEIARLSDIEIDAAFVVLDPRQEGSGGWGMKHFLKNVRAHYIFPMHCWEDYQLIEDFKKENDHKIVTGQIMKIEKPGQEFHLA